jgi:hypothetical protein
MANFLRGRGARAMRALGATANRKEEREPMPAYALAEVEGLDKERYKDYKRMVPRSLAA